MSVSEQVIFPSRSSEISEEGNERASNWSEDQTIELIDLVISPQFQKQFTGSKKSHRKIWDSLALRLTKRKGVNGEHAANKWNRLKKQWKAAKPKDGAPGEYTFQFYALMEKYMKNGIKYGLRDVIKDTERDEDFSDRDSSESELESTQVGDNRGGESTPKRSRSMPKGRQKRKKKEEDGFIELLKSMVEQQKKDSEILQQTANSLTELVNILKTKINSTPPPPPPTTHPSSMFSHYKGQLSFFF